jgi:hypothetical protein
MKIIALAFFSGLVFHAPNALAHTLGPANDRPATKGGLESSLRVTTQRSDGAVFPAVSQQARSQRSRRVNIAGSRQALLARGAWRMNVEPPEGGEFVAKAGEVARSGSESHAPVIVYSKQMPRR